jgi:ABC-type bacteriocin/lantibiotic exporter with double-glycine peptidase domain
LFSIIIALAEIISLSSFYFAIKIISEQELTIGTLTYKFNTDLKERIVSAFLLLTPLFLIKGILNYFYVNNITKVIYNIQFSISNIRVNQLKKNFTKINFSESTLQREIIKDSHDITRLGFNQLILLATESSIIIFSLISLLFIQFESVFYSFIFLFFTFLIYTKIANSISNSLGDRKKASEKNRIRLISDLSKGLLELGILNKLNYWSGKLINLNLEISEVEIKQSRIGQYSKIIFDLVGFTTFFVAIYIYSTKDPSLVGVVTFTTTYGILLARLASGVSKSVICLNNIKFVDPLLQSVISESRQPLKDELSVDLNKIPFSIKFDSVAFKHAENIIFNNLSFSIKKGDFVGIKGRSGSGKSTLTRLLFDYIVPSQGKICLLIQDELRFNVNFNSNIAIVTQTPFFFQGSVIKNITLDDNLPDLTLLNEIVSNLNDPFLNELSKNKFSYIMNENLDNLSGGQLQKIMLLRALYSKRQIIILDEFTSALDYDSEQIILNLLIKLKGKKTILIISHRENPYSLCDSIINLN